MMTIIIGRFRNGLLQRFTQLHDFNRLGCLAELS